MKKYHSRSFPLKLKLRRIEIGKSQGELARDLGISRSCLANYETGKRRPDAEMLAKIARACHVMTDFFIDHPYYQEIPLHEENVELIKKKKALSQPQCTTLDISHLPMEHKISLLEFYDYIINSKRQNTQNRHVFPRH